MQLPETLLLMTNAADGQVCFSKILLKTTAVRCTNRRCALWDYRCQLDLPA